MNLIPQVESNQDDAERARAGAADSDFPKRLCTVTTLRAPKEEILPFVNYHLNVGIDQMFLFFDDPADPAANVVTENPRVTCILCTPEHWIELAKRDTRWLPEFVGTKPPLTEDRQNLNATLALEMARAQNFEWIAHLDVDELLYAPGGLRSLLNNEKSSVDFIRFPVLEAVANDLSETKPMQSIELFKVAELRLSNRGAQPTFATRLRRYINRIAHRLKRVVAQLTQAEAIFAANGELIVGHFEGKSFVRTSSHVSCLKCHTPMAKPGSSLQFTIARHGYLLHFDCCNFDQWYCKWLRRCDGTGTLRSMAPHRQRQFTKFRTLHQRQATAEMRALYREQCLVPVGVASTLLRLALVKRIRLPDTLFAVPPKSSSTVCV